MEGGETAFVQSLFSHEMHKIAFNLLHSRFIRVASIPERSSGRSPESLGRLGQVNAMSYKWKAGKRRSLHSRCCTLSTGPP